MHFLMFVLTVVFLSFFIQFDMKFLNPVRDKSCLFFLMSLVFLTIIGTLLSYWEMWLIHCHFLHLNNADNFVSLSIGAIMLLLFFVSLIKFIHRQNHIRQIAALAVETLDKKLSQQMKTYALQMQLKCIPNIVLTKMIKPFAATFHAFHPVILLSETVVKSFDQEELDAVLVHEMAHIRENDLFLGCWVNMIYDVLWFVPGMSKLHKLCYEAMEYQADRRTVQVTHKPGALASALFKFETIKQVVSDADKNSLHLAYTSSFSQEGIDAQVERRLEHLLEDAYTTETTNSKSMYTLLTPYYSAGWLMLLWISPYCEFLHPIVKTLQDSLYHFIGY